MKPTLPSKEVEAILARLHVTNAASQKNYPGDLAVRQPVHTMYGGAHLFKAETPSKLGAIALASLEKNAANFFSFAKALGLPGAEHLGEGANAEAKYEKLLAGGVKPEWRGEDPHVWLAAMVYSRVKEKLAREPIEDYRIDFEDGYGYRPDGEEDEHAVASAIEVSKAFQRRILPPFIGIRIKALTEETKARSIRTLDLFLSALLEATSGKLPDNFVVTLPKVTSEDQVSALCKVLRLIERQTHLAPNAIRVEYMIEQSQALIDKAGICPLLALVSAAGGRCVGLNFGVYDFTASLDVVAEHQGMEHPSSDFARSMMKTALAGTGIWLADGATNIMPVGLHRVGDLSPQQERDNEESIHKAWKLAYDHIQNSLRNGFYQGTDLHPAQLPVRYAACYAFFLKGLESATARACSFMDKAAQANLVGDVFDDAATGQGLLNYFLRALNCGAITMEDLKASGLTLDEIRTRSFLQIVNGRRGKERVQV